MELLEFIKREKIILNLNVTDQESALKVAEIAIASRISLITIEMNFKDASSVIKKLIDKYETKGVVVGASNVQTLEDIKKAREAGAQFIICLFHLKDMVKACQDQECVCAVGALSPTEVKDSLDAGSNVVFLAPCAAMGSEYVKFMTHSFGDVAFIAGGGITIKNFKDFLNAGAAAVLTDMVNTEDITKERYKKIGKDILEFMEERDVMD